MKNLNNLKLAIAATSAALVLSACGSHQALQSEMTSSDNTNIVGGEAVKVREGFAKSTVALATVNFGVFCSASLIADNIIVTAAHCADVAKEMAPGDRMVVIFNHSLTVKKFTGRAVTQIIQHSDWATRSESDKNTGDIAVMKFAGTLPVGYKAADVLTDSSLLKNGADVVLAGYGVLSMIPAVDAKVLMKASVVLTDKDFSETEVKFDQYKGRGACHGDSGGPAFTQVKGKWMLFGVTSRSATNQGGATCLEGSIYSNLAAQTKFLADASELLNKADAEATPEAPTEAAPVQHSLFLSLNN